MANITPYRGSLLNPSLKALYMPGFVAAATSFSMGDMLELTGNTNTEWVAMDADDTAFAAQVGVAGEEVKSADKIGYYRIIVPRPGDIFEYPCVSSSLSIGDALYWSTAQKVTGSAGSNIIARVVGFGHYPYPQYHLADGGVDDKGTTVPSITNVELTFVHGFSYYSLFDDLNT